jgi:NADPH-dependent 7-cyano-7-deazaguanine reductase QueF-like protein
MLYGVSATNYDILNYSYATANIFTKSININPLGINKIYDKNFIATFIYTISGIIDDDQIDISANYYYANFNNYNTGSNRLITISNIMLYGTSSTNYNILKYAYTTGSILTKSININPLGNNKIYDKKYNATFIYTISNIISGDQVDISFNNYYANFSDYNSGLNILITISNIMLHGVSATNYNILNYAYTTGSIYTKSININPLGINKIYDKNYIATFIYTISNIISGDQVDISYNYYYANFNNYNTGFNRLITISSIMLYGVSSLNYDILNYAYTTANILTKSININPLGNNKIYDKNFIASFIYTISGIIIDDQVDISFNSYYANFNNYNVGTNRLITISNIMLHGVSAINYDILNYAYTTGSIFTKSININPLGVNKIYDKNFIATFSYTISNIISGDQVDISGYYYYANFNDYNIGIDKLITISNVTLYGVSATNYDILNYSYTTGSIFTKSININPLGVNKIYDKNFIATFSYTISNIISGDQVDISGYYYYANFNNYNVGTNRLITISNIMLYGVSATNYDILNYAYTLGSILTKSININPLGTNKIYDKNFIATFIYTISNVISGDQVDISFNNYYANFNNYNVGTNRLITISNITLYGPSATNYDILNYSYTTGSIFTKSININPLGNNKIYDKNYNATFIYTISNIISGDQVDISGYYYYANFNDYNIGIDKLITISNIMLYGVSAINYNILNYGYTLGSIFTKSININPLGINKIYDKNFIATFTYTISGIINDDQVDISSNYYYANFNNYNTGFNRLITISNIILYGVSAINYDILNYGYTTGSIYTKSININPLGNNKIYDKKYIATFIYTISNIIDGDQVDISFNSYYANFNDYNFGFNRLITISNVLLYGLSATNYNILNYAYTLGSIYTKSININPLGNNKIYDKNYIAGFIYTISNIISGDQVDISANYFYANFSDYNSGIDKLITISNIMLYGVSATNYDILNYSYATANIFTKSININPLGVNKIYDKNFIATFIYTISGIIDDDQVDISANYYYANFNNYNTGTNRLITISNVILYGTSSTNYNILNYSYTTANILTKSININPLGNNKIYDKNYIATFIYTISNIISGDQVDISFNSYYANFNNYNTGFNRLITISNIMLYGVSATNYDILNYAYTIGSIFTKSININPLGINKIYDKNYIATFIYTISNIISGDQVDISYNYYYANFNDYNIGFNKLITISNVMLYGVSSLNYDILNYSYTTANILTKSININPLGNNKIYDKNFIASFIYTISGIISEDQVDISGYYYYANFNNYNVGSNRLITISNITLHGVSAINYDILNYAYTIGSILTKSININPLGVNKIYDKKYNATFIYTISNIISGDQVDISFNSYYANFNNYNADTNILITISNVILYGASATNYDILNYAYTLGSIYTKSININPLGINKIYDKNFIASFIYTISGIITDDQVDISGYYYYVNFNNYNVGTNRLITISNILLYGVSSTNYDILNYSYTIANILTKSININPLGNNKIYDKNFIATFSYTISNVIIDDQVDISFNNYYANFNDYNVGTNRLITISNITLFGVSATNYDILNYSYTLGSILTKSININPLGVNKIYDKNYNATFIYTISNIISGDQVDISGYYYYANFNDYNFGIDKLITISDIMLYGVSATNYDILNYSYTTGSIFTKSININPLGINKIYDKNFIATFTYTISGIINDDQVDISGYYYYANFNNYNIGINRFITISNVLLYGVSAINYDILNYAYTLGSIFTKPININPLGINKIYDKNYIATFVYTISGIITDDQVDISGYYYYANFNDYNVALNILVTISNIMLYGVSATNYDILNYSYTIGSILTKSININPLGNNKIYDKNYIASFIYTISNIINDDQVDISGYYYYANFNDYNIGSNKLITISNIILYGVSAINYDILSYSYTIGSIFTKSININPLGVNKIYDQNYKATFIYTISGIINDDQVDISGYYYYANFNDYNVGFNILITISNIMLHGVSAINYDILSYAYTNSNIYQKLSNFYINVSKTYDGNTNIYNLNYSLSGIITNDIVTLSSYISFYNLPYAGIQLITLSLMIFGGKDVNNYNIVLFEEYYGLINKKTLLIYYNPTINTYSGYVFNNYSVSYNGFILGEGSLALSGILNYAISLNTNDDIRNQQTSSVNYLIGGNKKNNFCIGYSYNGINWFNSSSPFANNCLDFATNNNIWVSVGDGNNTIAYSTNGINWIGLGSTIFSQIGYGIIYNNNKWIAVGYGTNSIAISYDGINWNGLGTNIFNIIGRSVNANKNIIVACGQGINTLAYSYNGNIWVGLGTTIFDNYCTNVINNGIMWLALGKGNLNTMAYSYDGINWFGLGKTIFDNHATNGDWDGNKWIVVGGGNLNTMAYSYDGIHWIGLGLNVFNDIGRTIVFDGNYWLASGGLTTFIFVYSINGFNWLPIMNSLDLNYAYKIFCKKSILFIDQTELIDYGNYFIKPSGYYSNNYLITFVGDYTYIQKAPIIIESYTFNKIFDGLLSYDYGIIFSGFKGIDNSSNLLGSINYITNAKSDVGTYQITISGLYSLNYNINNKTNKITIYKAPLIIKADNFSKIYDSLIYTPTFSILSKSPYDTNFSLSGEIIFDAISLNNKDVGNYTIIPSGLTSKNYDIKFINGLLQIIKAPLMIIAKDDSRIYTNTISNYIFVYTREHYFIYPNNDYNQTTNTIQTTIDFNDYDRVWSLEGYDGPCLLNFNYYDNDVFIGLTEINYQTINYNYLQYFFYFDTSSNVNIIEKDNYIPIGISNINDNFSICYDGNNIIYSQNNEILRIVQKNIRIKLYINTLIKNINKSILNIQFSNSKEYYYGANGLIYDGFKGDDNYLCLSGIVVYSGTSQGATEPGTYTIIPSGLTSNNYNIQFINGILNIKKSLLTTPTII